MNSKRTIEVFSAGCPVCRETIDWVNRVAGPGCAVRVLDLKDPQVAKRASDLGIRSLPAVAIAGKRAECCAARGPDEATLRSAGLGDC